jgi:hypothetical protein
MQVTHRPSIWRYIGIVILMAALGPFVLGFFAVLTWGMIFVPVVVVIWFGPWFLLHWVLWGQAFSREAAEGTKGLVSGAAVSSTKHPLVLAVLRLSRAALVIIGVAFYYLWLFGGFSEH